MAGGIYRRKVVHPDAKLAKLVSTEKKLPAGERNGGTAKSIAIKRLFLKII